MMPSVLARFRPAPLSSGFFLASILGMLVTLFYFDELAATRTGKSFALAFIILFVAMFIASIISMRRAPAGAQIALDYHLARSSARPPQAYQPAVKVAARPAAKIAPRPPAEKKAGARRPAKQRRAKKKSARARSGRRKRR